MKRPTKIIITALQETNTEQDGEVTHQDINNFRAIFALSCQCTFASVFFRFFLCAIIRNLRAAIWVILHAPKAPSTLATIVAENGDYRAVALQSPFLAKRRLYIVAVFGNSDYSRRSYSRRLSAITVDIGDCSRQCIGDCSRQCGQFGDRYSRIGDYSRHCGQGLTRPCMVYRCRLPWLRSIIILNSYISQSIVTTGLRRCAILTKLVTNLQ